MIFSSAGHCNVKGIKNYDPGAVGLNGRTEADEAVKVRNRVNAILRSKGYSVAEDKPEESLREYLARIKPGSASVVVEYHFDSSSNKKATGTSALVGDDANAYSIAFGKNLAAAVSDALGIKVRDSGTGKGFLFEKDSHRGRLGLMRKAGTVALLEICFISNPDDMAAYDDPVKFEKMCNNIANVIAQYEDLIK